MDPRAVTDIVLRTLRHNQHECTEKFYNWLRTCLTVASGSLALLIGLQNTYVPMHPVHLWMLQAAWGCLCLTIVTCFVALQGEWAAHARAGRPDEVKKLIEATMSGDQSEVERLKIAPPWYCLSASVVFPWAFAASFVLLAVFAVVNVGRGH